MRSFTLGALLTLFAAAVAAHAEYRVLTRYEIGGGIGLHWPALDEDLSVTGMMAGVDRQSA